MLQPSAEERASIYRLSMRQTPEQSLDIGGSGTSSPTDLDHTVWTTGVSNDVRGANLRGGRASELCPKGSMVTTRNQSDSLLLRV